MMWILRPTCRLLGILLLVVTAVRMMGGPQHESSDLALVSGVDPKTNLKGVYAGYVGDDHLQTLDALDVPLRWRYKLQEMVNAYYQLSLERTTYLTPDGQWIIKEGGDLVVQNSLFARNLTEGKVNNIAMDRPNAVTFSPDSRWVYFHTVGAEMTRFYRVSIDSKHFEDLTPKSAPINHLVYTAPEHDLLIFSSRANSEDSPAPLVAMNLEGGDERVLGDSRLLGNDILEYLPSHDVLLINNQVRSALNWIRASDGAVLWQMPGNVYYADSTSDESAIVLFMADGTIERIDWDGTDETVLLAEPPYSRLTRLLPNDTIWIIRPSERYGRAGIFQLTLDGQTKELADFGVVGPNPVTVKDGWVTFEASEWGYDRLTPYRMRYDGSDLQPLFDIPGLQAEFLGYAPRVEHHSNAWVVGLGGGVLLILSLFGRKPKPGQRLEDDPAMHQLAARLANIGRRQRPLRMQPSITGLAELKGIPHHLFGRESYVMRHKQRLAAVGLALAGLSMVVATGPLSFRQFEPDQPQTKTLFLGYAGTYYESRYVVDLEGHVSEPLNAPSDIRVYVGWSNDGNWLYFLRVPPTPYPADNPTGATELWQVPRTGGEGQRIDLLDNPILPIPVVPPPPVTDFMMGDMPMVFSDPNIILPNPNQGYPSPGLLYWTPDGAWMIYPQLNASGRIDLIKRSSDGREVLNVTDGRVPYIYFGATQDYGLGWRDLYVSPDGQWVYFYAMPEDEDELHLFRAALDGTVLQDIDPHQPMVLKYMMPDGEWLLLASLEKGNVQQYWKMRVDGTELQQLVAPFGPYGHGWLAAYLPKYQTLVFMDQGAESVRAFRWPDGEPLWGYPSGHYLGVSPDEEWLVICARPADYSPAHLATMHPDGTAHRLLGTTCDEKVMDWTSAESYIGMHPSPSISSSIYRWVRLDGTAAALGDFPSALGFGGWTPDREWILMDGQRQGSSVHAIYKIRPDGTELTELIPADDRHIYHVEAMGPTITIDPEHTKWQPSRWLWVGAGLMGLSVALWIFKRPKAA